MEAVEVENASVVAVDVALRGVRLRPRAVGYLWGIRTEVVAGQAFPLVTGLQPWDCKSIAKGSKVRILHLPPRAERAPDAMKERGLLPLPAAPPSVMIGSIEVPH
jgi:hypothetical protein